MVRVFILEPNFNERNHIKYIIDTDPELHLIASARDIKDALSAVRRFQPDVVIMGFEQHEIDIVSAVQVLYENKPVPIIVLAPKENTTELQTIFKSLKLSGVSVLIRPPFEDPMKAFSGIQQIVKSIKLMATVSHNAPIKTPTKVENQVPRQYQVFHKPERDFKIIAIGTSTGGPPVLQKILSSLPKEFPIPIVIVQHISAGFTVGFVEWLDKMCHVNIRIPENNEKVLPGYAYIAPDGIHMGVTKQYRIFLEKSEREHNVRPAASYLFRSINKSFGKESIGILLTGMGKDGAVELKNLHDSGAFTLSQDEHSSVVFGMPKEAIQLGAVDKVLPPEGIAMALKTLVGISTF